MCETPNKKNKQHSETKKEDIKLQVTLPIDVDLQVDVCNIQIMYQSPFVPEIVIILNKTQRAQSPLLRVVTLF